MLIPCAFNKLSNLELVLFPLLHVMLKYDILMKPWFQCQPQVNKSLSKGRFTENIFVILFFFQVKLLVIVGEGFHAQELVVESSETRLGNKKTVFVVGCIPEKKRVLCREFVL